MIKMISTIIVLAAGIYIGMNWDDLTGQLKSEGIDMIDEAKDRAEDAVKDIVDKVN